MWTLREVAEHIISSVNSFNDTVGSRINPRQVESMIPNLRQQSIISKYNGSRTLGASKRIEGDWIQKFDLIVDPTIQDSALEYLIVECPKFIAVNENVSGMVYLGRKDKTQSFKVAQTRDEINTLKARGFINNGKNIVVLYSETSLEIYGDPALKSLYVEGILQFPSEKPGFNEESEAYPVSSSILDIMISLFKQNMSVAINQPSDTVADQADTNSIRSEKINAIS